MAAFIIALSIAFTIFFITSIVVLVRRRQKATQNVGYIISEGGAPVVVTSATHTPHGGIPVQHYPPPPPNYHQPSYYPYPAQTNQVMVQMPIQGMQTSPGMQQHIYAHQAAMSPPISYNATTSSPEISVLPTSNEKSGLGQTHLGAVETVSQI